MKKSVLTLVLIALVTAASAQFEQRQSFAVNTFLSGGVGVGFFSTSGNSVGNGAGFSGGIAYGKWILQPLAMSVGVDAIMTNVNDQSRTYLFGSAQFMWDLLSAFGSIQNSRVNVLPIVGLGVYSQQSASSSTSNIHTMFGLHVPVRIKNGLSAFAEYKCFVLAQSTYADYLHAITVGATYNFLYFPYSRRSEYATHGMFEDWFLGYGLGANVALFDFKGFNDFGRYSIMPEIMIGRNYTPRWTIRFELSGLFAHNKDNEMYRYTDFHADVLFNLSNLMGFTRGRRLGIMPYLGAGPVWRYDSPNFSMCANGGLFLRYYVSPRSDIFVDAKYTMIPHYVAGGGSTDSRYGVGIASLTFGYIYNMGTSTTRYRMPIGR